MSIVSLKPVIPGMRLLLLVAGLLVFIAGIQLFIFTEQTDQYFAWTIANPLTAAFLGGAYWSSFLLVITALPERHWVNARIAVPGVLLFTGLTLIVTLIHLDKFHLGDKFMPITQFLTWAWMLVYILVPVIISLMLVFQWRKAGGEPERKHVLPVWVRGILGVYAVIMLSLGVGLLLTPDSVSPLWPWALTALTARALGAWLIGLGVAAIHTIIENDWRRVLPSMAGLTTFGLFELIAVLRYLTLITLGAPNGILYIVILITMLVLGIFGCWKSYQVRRNES